MRQAAIGPYFVDFLCRDEKLVIEVDGATHASDDERDNDLERDRFLCAAGYRVVRFSNGDVIENLPGVLDALVSLIGSRGDT